MTGAATAAATVSVSLTEDERETLRRQVEDGGCNHPEFTGTSSDRCAVCRLTTEAVWEAAETILAARFAAAATLADNWVLSEREADDYGPRSAFNGYDCAEMLRETLNLPSGTALDEEAES